MVYPFLTLNDATEISPFCGTLDREVKTCSKLYTLKKQKSF